MSRGVLLRAVHGELVAPSAWHITRADLVALIVPSSGYLCVAVKAPGSKSWKRWTSEDGAAWTWSDAGSDARSLGEQLRAKLEALPDPGAVAALGALKGSWRAEVLWPGGSSSPPSIALSRRLTSYAEIELGSVQAPGKVVWKWRTVATRSGPWVKINRASTTDTRLADALRTSILQTIELSVKPSCAARDTQPRMDSSRSVPLTHDPGAYALRVAGQPWATDGAVAVRKGTPTPAASSAWFIESERLGGGEEVIQRAINDAGRVGVEVFPATVKSAPKGTIFYASADGRHVVGVASRMKPILKGGQVLTTSAASTLAPLVVKRRGEAVAVVMPFRYDTPPVVERVDEPKPPKEPKAKAPKAKAPKAPKAAAPAKAPKAPKAEAPAKTPKAPPKAAAPAKAPKAPPKAAAPAKASKPPKAAAPAKAPKPPKAAAPAKAPKAAPKARASAS